MDKPIPTYIFLKLHISQFERLNRLIEKDEKNRQRAREAIRNKKKSPNSLSPSEGYVKPIAYEILKAE